MARADELFRKYNEYRFHTHNTRQLAQKGVWIRSLKPTPDRLKALDAMGEWCSERSIDPIHWLYSLFEARRWMFAPRFDHLISEKHLTKNPTLRVSKHFGESQQREVFFSRQREGGTYDANKDLSGPAEALKRRYLSVGDAERCLSEMTERTLGFHPKSLLCARCPLAGRCEEQLQSITPFDITKLRRGEMTLEEAQRIAMQSGRTW